MCNSGHAIIRRDVRVLRPRLVIAPPIIAIDFAPRRLVVSCSATAVGSPATTRQINDYYARARSFVFVHFVFVISLLRFGNLTKYFSSSFIQSERYIREKVVYERSNNFVDQTKEKPKKKKCKTER